MRAIKSKASHVASKFAFGRDSKAAGPPVADKGCDIERPEPSLRDVPGGQNEPHSCPTDKNPSVYYETLGESPRRATTQHVRVADSDIMEPSSEETREQSQTQLTERENAQLRRKLADITRHSARLRQGRDEALREKTRLKQDLDKIVQENIGLQKRLHEMEQHAGSWKHEATRYRTERDAAHLDVEQVSRKEATQRREEALVKENAQLRTLLETRRRELQDAQHFMGTVDTYSESEVVEEVRSLNAEIFSLVRAIADGAEPDQDPHALAGAEEDVVRAVGQPFHGMLKSTDTRGDTILLEVAMQAAAAGYLAWIIRTWLMNAEGDSILASVYKGIRDAENQSVAGQWRALTRKFAQVLRLGSQQLEDQCNKGLSEMFWDSVALARMRPSPDSDPKEAIQILARKALKIRHLIGEAMKSSEYEILLPQPGATFMAEDMEDVYSPKEGRRTGSESYVLCCVALGLRRVEKVGEGLRSVTLVKPEVGLQTLLTDLNLADGDIGKVV
ncbi:hypothetical protein EVJ58_g2218 [Rhodofomes roseus]|uniref:Uncharacterized protein n=1 Tax=Rhodofomes roseus TaxID=34475 RepID=A0A4Y9YRK9_9APHY|nr:hypothetical protein EVJ58_g2218 [Rhodofomes roseus]